MKQKFFSEQRISFLLLAISAICWQKSSAKPVWSSQYFLPDSKGKIVAAQFFTYEKLRTLKRFLPDQTQMPGQQPSIPNNGNEYNATAVTLIQPNLTCDLALQAAFPIVQKRENQITGQGLGQIYTGLVYNYLDTDQKGLWINGSVSAGLYLPTSQLKDPIIGTRSTDFQVASILSLETVNWHVSATIVGRFNTQARYKGFDKITGIPNGNITAPFDLWKQTVAASDDLTNFPSFTPIPLFFNKIQYGHSITYNFAIGYRPLFKETEETSNLFGFIEFSGKWEDKTHIRILNFDGSVLFNGKYNSSGGHTIYAGPSLHYEFLPPEGSSLIKHYFMQFGIQAPIYRELNEGTLTVKVGQASFTVPVGPDEIKAIRQSRIDYRLTFQLGGSF